MLCFNHIFWTKTALVLCLVFLLGNGLQGQAWIIDTPTGKLSTWTIQRDRAQPQKAELFLLNQTNETVFFDDYNTNDNYLEIISPGGVRVITRKRVLDEKLFIANNPKKEKAAKWEVDFFDYLKNLDFNENGHYLFIWHLKTSKGYLSAEPVKLFFEKIM